MTLKVKWHQAEAGMNYKIRELKRCEINLLDEFLYEAIFVPEGAQAPLRDIVKHPELQKYIADFGRKDDVCYVAEVEGRVIGAVWTRIIHDFAHIDDETPSLSISLFKEYRNLGVGTALMQQILLALKERGYRQVSLSVQKANPALRMYEKLGFEVAHENEQDCIMIRGL